MIEIGFTEAMIQSAVKRALGLGRLNNSVTEGAGNVAGYIGEDAVARHLGANRDDQYSHDLLMYDGRRIEVKTKRRSVKPLPYYEVTVGESSRHQNPDVYAFVSLHFGQLLIKPIRTYDELKVIWLCGFISRERFWKVAFKIAAGQVDPTNGFKATADIHNVRINQLSETLEG